MYASGESATNAGIPQAGVTNILKENGFYEHNSGTNKKDFNRRFQIQIAPFFNDGNQVKNAVSAGPVAGDDQYLHGRDQ
jgi:hypothetical protein